MERSLFLTTTTFRVTTYSSSALTKTSYDQELLTKTSYDHSVLPAETNILLEHVKLLCRASGQLQKVSGAVLEQALKIPVVTSSLLLLLPSPSTHIPLGVPLGTGILDSDVGKNKFLLNEVRWCITAVVWGRRTPPWVHKPEDGQEVPDINPELCPNSSTEPKN